MRPSTTRIASIAAFMFLGIAAPIHAQQSTPLPSSACASLEGFSIPASAIGLPTSGGVVQTAVRVSATDQGNVNGDFCKVTGIVKPHNAASPNLEFAVNLPVAWSRRVLQMGGGGYNGSLVTGLTGFTLQPANVDNPLKQGFVTVGTDGGHKAPPGFDGSFGMDDEAQRRIFEPYFSTKATGTGLGLTIAKRNVELSGGTIAVRSARGAGTTVTLTLPVAAASRRPARG